jgi:hypothetical protein
MNDPAFLEPTAMGIIDQIDAKVGYKYKYFDILA